MKRIVLTGGPGAGKTAVQHVAVQAFPGKLVTVPESATILFTGGFPRLEDAAARQAAQRAIFYVQRELEALHAAACNGAALLCDRGTIDGSAYWRGDGFFESVGTTRAEQLARYHAVIFLAVPSDAEGYDHRNPTRIENASEAATIGKRIHEAWDGHPRFLEVPSVPRFWDKVQRAVDLIGKALEEFVD